MILNPIKFSLWDLIWNSHPHREALDQNLNPIELNTTNPNAFANFIGSVQENIEYFIPFYQHEIWNVTNLKFKDPPLHIIA